ncbi:hypothetical protein X801_05016 [Opisthorchis viverrini]|uniref:ATP synthase subunit g n=2 Tax=Opisthorchis viverrini TaxID=6198 RepID=A0A074ZC94_OPIVI|nr:hypothetical protein T265_07495 [Opisthorchis viverrini]KER24926.1 hypothetical protein T265_07495 [Opisthorchis viverrini]OON19120.1 hypothetical protein X801_05016 [Opisthorchis viverrini]
MESTVAKLISLASKVASTGISKGRPALSKFMNYARVEMRPPTLSDIGPAVAEATQLINAAKSGRWKEVTVKDGLLNAVVTIEVLAWFFIGEIIGRRSILGYSRVPGCYIQSHL